MRRTAALVLITLACFACGEDAELDPSEGQSNGYGPLTDAGEVEADVAPPLDSQMDWTIDSGELLGEYQGNLARECKLEKEGQYYLSATYFEDGNLTFGIRFRPTGETPEEIPIVGLNAGQDPEPGQGLAALSGSLMSPEPIGREDRNTLAVG